MIRYLEHHEIDKAAYDSCIESAEFESLYAYSWYLDCVAPGWSALIQDDYRAVMPLPHAKKLYLNYIFTPIYVQQLGIFMPDAEDETVADFLKAIPNQFRLIDLKGHEMMRNLPDNIRYIPRTNYILDLEKDYPQTSKKYNRNCRRKLRMAENAKLQVGPEITSQEFTDFVRKNLGDQLKELTPASLKILGKLTHEGVRRNKAKIVAVSDRNGKMLAAASFLFARERIIFSVCASNDQGKQLQAMSFLVDSQIRNYAGEYKYFDFSGSEIKGIAYFNSTFGARKVTYPDIRINKLSRLEQLITGKRKAAATPK